MKENLRWFLVILLCKVANGFNVSGFELKAAISIHLGNSQSFNEYIIDPRIRQADAMAKYHYSLFLLMQEIHQFSFTTIILNKTKNIEPGNLNNLIPILKTQKIDISISGGLLTNKHISQISYLFSFYDYRSCFFFRVPQKSALAIIKPFSTKTWLATIAISAIMTFAIKVSFLEGNCKGEEDEEGSSWTWSFFIVLSVLWQAGCFVDVSPCPSGVTWRFIFLNLMLTSLLLHCYYTSSQVSLLLASQNLQQYAITDLANSEIKIATDGQPYILQFINDTNLYDVKLLCRKNIELFEVADGLRRLEQGNFAYHTDTSTAYDFIGKKFMQEAICSLTETKIISSNFGGLVLEKTSKFNEMFRVSLLRLRQNGLLDREKKIWVAEKPECSSNPEVVPLGMAELFSGYVCLVLGILIALIVLHFERKHKG